jgi:3-methyl-2-oxobutanoate hydroxymethyltransferase
LLTAAGIPVMAHVGLTPQSVNTMSGYRVQGRGDEAGQRLLEDARALQDAGAFALVMEVVPSDLAKKVTHDLHIPTVGIGAGVECDAQVLVWQDMAGLRGEGKPAKFVKQYADVSAVLTAAVHQFAAEVQAGIYPGAEHSYH